MQYQMEENVKSICQAVKHTLLDDSTATLQKLASVVRAHVRWYSLVRCMLIVIQILGFRNRV